MRIAICDDNKAFLSSLHKKIKQLLPENVEIVEFCNGAELVKHCKTNSVDIILLDIDMPLYITFYGADCYNEKQAGIDFDKKQGAAKGNSSDV